MCHPDSPSVCGDSYQKEGCSRLCGHWVPDTERISQAESGSLWGFRTQPLLCFHLPSPPSCSSPGRKVLTLRSTYTRGHSCSACCRNAFRGSPSPLPPPPLCSGARTTAQNASLFPALTALGLHRWARQEGQAGRLEAPEPCGLFRVTTLWGCAAAEASPR